MYELSVERVFCASHAILINGEMEPVHGHNWRVEVVVAGAELDANGLLCDFHLIERKLEGVVGRLHNRHLNDTPEFARTNPTAELVAAHIGQALRGTLPAGVQLARVRVTEAPGCVAAWIPQSS